MGIRSYFSDSHERPAAGRLAVVLGNATLLGVGYVLTRQLRALAVTLIISAGLLSLVVAWPDFTLWRVLVVVWWVVVVLHGWRSASKERHGFRLDRSERIVLWRNRLIAVLCLLLVAFGWYRFDTWRITGYAEAAHTAGDCDRATAALRWLGRGHELANSPAVARGEDEGATCEQLIDALALEDPGRRAAALGAYIENPDARWADAGLQRTEDLFDNVWSSETLETVLIENAFVAVSDTLKDQPGQTEALLALVAEFRADLAERAELHACEVEEINAWLDTQTWESPELAEALAPEAEAWPERIIACTTSQGGTDYAGELYQKFLTRFPDHDLAGQALSGLIEDELYCDFPAAYAQSPAYEGKGPHPAQFTGIDPAEYGFADGWQSESAETAELAVCVEGPERGNLQETCYYEPGSDDLPPVGGGIHLEDVDFYATKFTVKAYALRTGELVAEYTKEIGDPCPDELEYEYYAFDVVPGEYDSDYSDKDVRGIFAPLLD